MNLHKLEKEGRKGRKKNEREKEKKYFFFSLIFYETVILRLQR